MPGSRPHHYQFAHAALPDLAKTIGPQLLDVPPQGAGAPESLVAVWDGLGDSLPPEDRLSGDGLSGELFDADGGHRMLVVTMPPPLTPPEAYFAALVRPAGSDAVRCFTLELGISLEGEPYTVIGEWVDGGHRNYGPGPSPVAESFAAALGRLLSR